jgi:hypothetical protein
MKQLFLWKELIIVCISVIVVFHTVLYFFNRDEWKQYSYPEYFATVSFPQPPTEDVRTVQVEGIGPRKSVTYYSRDVQKNYYFFGHVSYPKEKGTLSYQDRMNKLADATAELGFDITKMTYLQCVDNVRCSVLFEGTHKNTKAYVYGIRILAKEHFYQAHVISSSEKSAYAQGRIFVDSIEVGLGNKVMKNIENN